MPFLQYGYCRFTMNTINGKCLFYSMDIDGFTMNTINGKCLFYSMDIVDLP